MDIGFACSIGQYGLKADTFRTGGKAVKEGAPKAEAEEIKAKPEAAGAEVELK